MFPRRDPEGPSIRKGALQMLLVAAVAAAVFFLDVVLREMSEGPELTIAAPAARHLQPGADVWVAGVPAGRVTSVRFRERSAGQEPVMVRAVLSEDAAPTIRRDASATIHQSALLAPAVVSVRPGSDPAAFDFSDTLRARPLTGAGDVLAQLDSLAAELRGLRPLRRRLERRLEEGPGTLAALRADTALGRELRGLAERVEGLAERLPAGSAARLAADGELAATWDTLAARSRRIARRLGERAGPAAAALDSLGASAARISRRLEEGRGSLARFATDSALAREARTMRARMDSVRAALLEEPLRWLRFRLF